MDGRRSVALAGSCAAFVAVPTLGALLGEGERTRRYDTVVTPPGYAFVVWAPIFAGAIASTVAQCRPAGRGRAVSRATGWPLAAAYTVNTAWSLAAQTDRFGATPCLLPAAAACAAVAHVRLQRVGEPAGITPVSTGLLLGWTALASFVNVVAVARPGRRAATAGLVAVAGAVAGGVAGSRRGALPVAAASGWGLLTTALDRRRPRPVRLAAAAGAASIGVAALLSSRRSRASSAG